MSRIRMFLLILLVVALPGGAFATASSVIVLPPNPAETDSIFLETRLSWGTSGYWVLDTSTTFLSPFEVFTSIFVSSPGPDDLVAAVITDEDHITPLGFLPAGIYSYTVKETDVQRETSIWSLGGSVSGTFTVVPEPSSFALVLLGVSGLAIRLPTKRRCRSAAHDACTHR